MPNMMHGWKPRRTSCSWWQPGVTLEYTHKNWPHPVRRIEDVYVSWNPHKNNVGMLWKTFREAREEIQSIVNEKSPHEAPTL